MSNKIKIIISSVFAVSVILVFLVIYIVALPSDNKNELSVNVESITLEVGDSVDLSNYYTVKSKKSLEVLCLSQNNALASVTNEKTLTANASGQTKIYFKITDGKGGYIEKFITANIIDKQIIPSVFSFEKESVVMGVDTAFIENKIISDVEFNVIPNVSYSNDSICSYNYQTGKIYPLNEGTTTITVQFSHKNRHVENGFEVCVKNNYCTIALNNTTKIGDEYYKTLSVNASSFLTYDILNNENNNEYTMMYEIVENSCDILVQKEYSKYILKGTKQGVAKIKFYLKEDESVYVILNVEVS